MKDLKEKQKIFVICIFVALFIFGIFLGTFLGLSRKNKEENEKKNGTEIKEITEKLDPISIEDCINNGYFVIDTASNKIYNNDILDKFIENTGINAKNRIEDKIRIVNYNFDGAPTIYDLEYKISGEKSGYILTTDTRRTTYVNDSLDNPHTIVVNDDIPGRFYGITLTEHSDINAVSIDLALYAIIDYVDANAKIYEPIEITRYLMNSEIINKSL